MRSGNRCADDRSLNGKEFLPKVMTPDRCAMLTAYVRNNRCVVGLSHVTRPSGIQRLSFISESFNLNETVTVERKRKSETVKLDIFPAPWNNIPQILIGSEKRKLRVCNVPILLLLVTYCRRPFPGLKGGGEGYCINRMVSQPFSRSNPDYITELHHIHERRKHWHRPHIF